jgi:hypothetical protein
VLVIPACSEKQWKGAWTEVLYPAIYPQLGFEHEPKVAPGCPPFGRDPILDRDGVVPASSPAPGLHRASTMKNGVVWWDPKTLELSREERSGLEAADALQDDPEEAPKSIAAFNAWRDSRAIALGTGQVPGEIVVTPRELPPVLVAATLQVEDTGQRRTVGGVRFGDLVHSCLAVIPLTATDAEIQQTAVQIGRLLKAPEREVRAAAQAVSAALKHPLVSAARNSSDVRREVSIVDHLDDGTVIEGVIDLAYLDGEVWQLVEFKTDLNIEENRLQHEAQAQAYVQAIGRATGKPGRAVILRV